LAHRAHQNPILSKDMEGVHRTIEAIRHQLCGRRTFKRYGFGLHVIGSFRLDAQDPIPAYHVRQVAVGAQVISDRPVQARIIMYPFSLQRAHLVKDLLVKAVEPGAAHRHLALPSANTPVQSPSRAYSMQLGAQRTKTTLAEGNSYRTCAAQSFLCLYAICTSSMAAANSSAIPREASSA
jgi:hypothetical protein